MERKPEENLGGLGLGGVCREILRVIGAQCRFFALPAAGTTIPLAALLLATVVIFHALHPPRHDSVAAWAAFILFGIVSQLALVLLCTVAIAIFVISVTSLHRAESNAAAIPEVTTSTFARLFHTVGCANIVAHVTALLVLLPIVSAGEIGALLLSEKNAPDVHLLLLLGGAAYLAAAAAMVYVGVVCHLALVVSVLEDASYLHAMRKSGALLAGKFWTAATIFETLDGCFLAALVGFLAVAVEDMMGLGFGFRVAVGLVMASALWAVMAATLVAQPVVYLVCKSYHHENVDKASLSYDDDNGVELQQVQTEQPAGTP